MRKRIITVGILIGLGLALLALWNTGAWAPDAGSEGREGSRQAQAQPGAAQQESPGDLGVRGSADTGSTPALALPPSEEDGVLEVEVLAGARPVPGATVRLYWRGPRDPKLDEVSWRLASTGTTDAQGHARLASKPGGYQVSVRAQGYGALLRDVVRPYGEARTLLRLSLEPGQRLTGRTVVSDTQEPLPLVELSLTAHGHTLEPWQSAEAPAEERSYASSDAHAHFQVEGLAPGDYLLEARAVGYARAQQRVKVPAAGPLTVALHRAAVIEGFVVDAQGAPAAGAEVQVSGRVPQTAATGPGGGFSLQVEPGNYLVSARRGAEAGSLDTAITVSAGGTLRDVRIQLGQGGTLEGRVVARGTGAPVSGASVEVSPYGKNGDAGRARTDALGHFSVGGLAPGSYDLTVGASGFSSVTRRALTVSAGKRFPVELQLTGTGAVEGTVRTAAGQPVAGVPVTGGRRWAGKQDDAPVETRTDAEGHYRLEGLAAGSVIIYASPDEAAMAASLTAQVTEGGTARADFTLEELGTVEGVVRVAGGALPSEPLFVNTIPMEGQSSFYKDFGHAAVDAAGRFRLKLAPGTYGLTLFPGDHISYDGTELRVEAGKTVQLELNCELPRHALGIGGIVLEPDGTPSVEALVTLLTEGSQALLDQAPTESTGRFSFSVWEGQEVTASTRVRVSARNGGRTGEVQGVKPGEQSVVVRLKPGASVRGQLVRATGGRPIQGFTVALDVQGPRYNKESRGPWEFAGDRFELRDVPVGSMTLQVKTEDGAFGEARVSTSPSAVAEVQVSLTSTGSIRGRVVDPTTKEPFTEVSVAAQGPSRESDRPKSDGRFTLERLLPGQYTLAVIADGPWETVRKEVTLSEGQVLELGDMAIGPMRIRPGFVGLRVRQEGTQLLVHRAYPGSPAANAGLQTGDVLLTVNGAPVTNLEETYQRLQGAPGSKVAITVRRAGSEQSLSITRAP